MIILLDKISDKLKFQDRPSVAIVENMDKIGKIKTLTLAVNQASLSLFLSLYCFLFIESKVYTKM